jgi:hypothetical protein
MQQADCYHLNIGLRQREMVEELNVQPTTMQSYWNGTIRSIRGPYQSMIKHEMWV